VCIHVRCNDVWSQGGRRAKRRLCVMITSFVKNRERGGKSRKESI